MCGKKRQRAAALQDPSESACSKYREASWSAAALCRFDILSLVRWFQATAFAASIPPTPVGVRKEGCRHAMNMECCSPDGGKSQNLRNHKYRGCASGG